MSPVTAITQDLRGAELSLKDEGKLLRMICAKANTERRQLRTGSSRLTLTPRVLRRNDTSNAPHA